MLRKKKRSCLIVGGDHLQWNTHRDDIPRIRQLVREVSKEIIEGANGKLEIISQYSRMVPVIMVQKYFGLDGVDRKKMLEWSYWSQYDSFYNQHFDLNAEEKYECIEIEHKRCHKEFSEYIKSLIIRKLIEVKIKDRGRKVWVTLSNALRVKMGMEPRQLKDDIVKRMLGTSFVKQIGFPMQRLGANVGGLLVGSVETSSKVVAHVVDFFIKHPELLKKAKAAAVKEETAEIDSMVWEALRFEPVSPYLFRQLSKDYTFGRGSEREVTLPKGTTILTLIQSAMFDSRVYENPDEFNPERDWSHHLTYGLGEHECLGKQIGMAMIPEMVRQLIFRENLQAVSSLDYKDGPFPEEYHLLWNDSRINGCV
ncbi:hypothetical protein AB835_04620 [Candidatus Endobugula sertula]|uniref:Cytochrome n=1 Tax=Candidatus Endobugula sertula TaxID=62101 RepID=A0A1D2QRZ9_9GAMM|nr:hypothetical protein AB835_04620 [Candidatus Endobugula sertula]